jgi:hypothetical protein
MLEDRVKFENNFHIDQRNPVIVLQSGTQEVLHLQRIQLTKKIRRIVIKKSKKPIFIIAVKKFMTRKLQN